MDIASMSVVMANQQMRMDAKVAVFNHAKQVAEQQGNQLIQMIGDSLPIGEHPSLGKKIDVSI